MRVVSSALATLALLLPSTGDAFLYPLSTRHALPPTQRQQLQRSTFQPKTPAATFPSSTALFVDTQPQPRSPFDNVKLPWITKPKNVDPEQQPNSDSKQSWELLLSELNSLSIAEKFAVAGVVASIASAVIAGLNYSTINSVSIMGQQTMKNSEARAVIVELDRQDDRRNAIADRKIAINVEADRQEDRLRMMKKDASDEATVAEIDARIKANAEARKKEIEIIDAKILAIENAETAEAEAKKAEAEAKKAEAEAKEADAKLKADSSELKAIFREDTKAKLKRGDYEKANANLAFAEAYKKKKEAGVEIARNELELFAMDDFSKEAKKARDSLTEAEADLIKAQAKLIEAKNAKTFAEKNFRSAIKPYTDNWETISLKVM